ncbi:cation transporter [Nitratireductor aquimarinus]|uniref:Cation diffusion facilitator family transporter n=1 Tax=Nitratireductor aquimarinus TaxID=889300 RepID=A0ABU4AG76_9HYPH|nr:MULTISPECIES: cation diffusion facilitator family transporter [Alphaproteobacteria]MBY6022440.1 cation diffusion facilitator family transporter [Nitratireductor sp. DP7N14-4]MBN7757649.1 cation transporter [Nitratireductor aquimarinus]MBN7763766.1 cation transporter [Nitratireductor aquibiodomus]MBN7775040.1 cation transporter [Nitratireductor pacificus]MBN7779901.1 cation transporter [Nitratireductor pacificus]
MPSNGDLQRIALWSIVVAFGIFGLKLSAWWLTDSVALFSDAMESVVNVVASFVAWYALRIAHRPADDNHPFGHHKAEYFSAVLEGVLIVVAALLIIHEAWTALFAPRALEAPVAGLLVNALAAVGNGLWAWLLISTGRKARSPAMVADGKHLWTDVVTSAGVIFGLVLAVVTGWLWLDPVMALIVAVNILWHGWHLVGDSVQGLMDVSVEPEELAEIHRVVEENSVGALEFHDLKTREAGRARFIEFHLVVPSDMTVEVAHHICDRIEGALEKSQPGAEVTIHVEPAHKAKFA